MMRFVTCSHIYELCVQHFGFDLDAHNRKRFYVYPRIVYYKLCKEHARDWSLATAGKIVGKDHATVVYNLRNFDAFKGEPWFSEYHLAYRLIAAKIGRYTGPVFNTELKCRKVKFKIDKQ